MTIRLQTMSSNELEFAFIASTTSGCLQTSDESNVHMTEPMTRRGNIRERIRRIAFELLELNAPGLRFSELQRQIQIADPKLNAGTINTSIWNLDAVFPERVYKPSKGLFRLAQFRQAELDSSRQGSRPRIREEAFYPLFASWLKNEIEDVTHAIPLGRNVFRDRWGTPDVLGKAESKRSDVIKGATSIVAAEIKTDISGIVTGFGQACAYRLFSHKSYLVIPSQTPQDELARVDSLCEMFGLGLVTFNPNSLEAPCFTLVVRPLKQEPDLFYTNRYIRHVEKELFS